MLLLEMKAQREDELDFDEDRIDFFGRQSARGNRKPNEKLTKSLIPIKSTD